MKTTHPDRRPRDASGFASWLRSNVTLTLPGWGVALGTLALLALILLALD